MPYEKVTGEDIKYLLGVCGADHILTGDAIHSDFTHDEMIEYGCYTPEVVVEAMDTGQVSRIMAYASERHIPVTPRGAGTGLCGSAVTIYGGILLSLAKMDRIIEFDRENFTVTLQPGVLLMDLAQAAIDEGMFYPPDPGEKSATVGGNVMTNAGGMRAVKYGVTRDYVRGMTAVLPDGRILYLGGKIAKNSSGYSLKDLIIGSEGTLAIVTELIMKLIPLPQKSMSLLVPFPDLAQCIRTVPKIIQSRITPTAVEFMEREVIEAAEEYLGYHFPDKSSDAYLLLTFDGNTKEQIDTAYEAAADVCLESGALDVYISDTEERQESIWKARGAFLEAIKTSTTEMDECDVVVPRNCIADFLLYVNDLQSDHGMRIRSFGHAGDGNLHIYLCRDELSEADWHKRRELLMDLMYKKAIEMQGQISGEHGIGHAKVGYLRQSVGEDTVDLMCGIKEVFDPQCILNPGKIISCLDN
jgi:glycolate oxidase